MKASAKHTICARPVEAQVVLVAVVDNAVVTLLELLVVVVVDVVELTVRARLQLCPPKLSANVAVPAPDGVPLMAYVKLPEPLASVPACKVAFKPVIPVDAMALPAE